MKSRFAVSSNNAALPTLGGRLIYFNENDRLAVEWLKNLWPNAKVDHRSIERVEPGDVLGYDRCHFFGGIGGWEYALEIAGWPQECEVWTGSCPCQPFSAAGKREGEKDKRHLWPAFRRIIAERHPATIFGEQVASSDGREWFARVRRDLEKLGYAVGAADLCAASVGSPHKRQRIFWVADSEHNGRRRDESKRGTKRRTSNRRSCSGLSVGALADAELCGARTGKPRGSNQKKRRINGARPSIGGIARRVGDTDGERESEIAGISERQDAQCERSPGVLADTNGGESGDGRLQPGGEHRQQPQNRRPVNWGEFDVVFCRDGRCRRVEPGTFPLAHGIPNRLGRLRGYGNAICPQLGAEFITAFLEAERISN